MIPARARSTPIWAGNEPKLGNSGNAAATQFRAFSAAHGGRNVASVARTGRGPLWAGWEGVAVTRPGRAGARAGPRRQRDSATPEPAPSDDEGDDPPRAAPASHARRGGRPAKENRAQRVIRLTAQVDACLRRRRSWPGRCGCARTRSWHTPSASSHPTRSVPRAGHPSSLRGRA